MKKIKNINIYKIYNRGSGDESFINFKPTKKDIKSLCQWQGWDYEENGDGEIYTNFDFFKINIYEK